MATDIKAPTFPESVAEGTVAAWHKKAGDSVERDELIVEIETDKVVLEVLAPEAGTLAEVLAEEGETVESEQVLGRIGEGSASGGKAEKADAKAEKSDAKAEQKASGGGKPHEVKAPTFPESIQEGTVASWNKQVGEAVKRDEVRSEEHTSELQSRPQLVCRLLLEKKDRHQ